MIRFFNAIFHKEPKTGECYAWFPNFPWLTVTGRSFYELDINCRIALARVLTCAEKCKMDVEIKNPDIYNYPEGIMMVIKVDTAEYKKLYDLEVVRRNVSIPSWLNKMAIEKNINFSKVLQNALMKACGVDDELKTKLLNEKKEVHSTIAKIKAGGLI